MTATFLGQQVCPMPPKGVRFPIWGAVVRSIQMLFRSRRSSEVIDRDPSVFISYARADERRANEVRRGLERAGIAVFWDEQLRPGERWPAWLQRLLERCSAVIVLWSKSSVRSKWVLREASIGLAEGKLIPALLEEAQIPGKFAKVQTAALFDHPDPTQCPAWTGLVCAVSIFVINSRTPERQDELEDLYYRFLQTLKVDGIRSEAVRRAFHRMSVELLEEAEPDSIAWHRIERMRGRS